MTDQERLKEIKGNWEDDIGLTKNDVNWLIQTVEEQQKLIAHWKKGFENENKIAGRLKRKFERSEKENARLREALGYISEIKQPDGGYVSRIEVAVTKARQALKQT